MHYGIYTAAVKHPTDKQRIPLLSPRPYYSTDCIGRRTQGIAISEEGHLYQSYGPITEIMELPLFVFVEPESAAAAAAEFKPFTYNALVEKCCRLNIARNTGRLAHCPVRSEVCHGGVWLAPGGDLMVGFGRIVQVNRLPRVSYVYIVEPVEEDEVY